MTTDGAQTGPVFRAFPNEQESAMVSEAEEIMGSYGGTEVSEDGETEGTIYEQMGESRNDLNLDCELQAVCEVRELRIWISENPTNRGNKYFRCSFTPVDIFGQNIPPEAPNTESKIGEGTPVSWVTELPEKTDPEKMSFGEQISLATSIECAAAILGVNDRQLGSEHVGQIARDNGKRVKGRKFGIDVDSDVKDQVIGGQEVTQVYFNPTFYPVDQETGTRIEAKSVKEVLGG